MRGALLSGDPAMVASGLSAGRTAPALYLPLEGGGRPLPRSESGRVGVTAGRQMASLIAFHPTPPAFAPLWRATLPLQGRVRRRGARDRGISNDLQGSTMPAPTGAACSGLFCAPPRMAMLHCTQLSSSYFTHDSSSFHDTHPQPVARPWAAALVFSLIFTSARPSFAALQYARRAIDDDPGKGEEAGPHENTGICRGATLMQARTACTAVAVSDIGKAPSCPAEPVGKDGRR
jgi:hypothetical protein